MSSLLQNPFVSRITHYIQKLLMEDVNPLNYLIEDPGHSLIPYFTLPTLVRTCIQLHNMFP